MTRTLSPLTLAISLALVAPAAFAQESAPADTRTLDGYPDFSVGCGV